MWGWKSVERIVEPSVTLAEAKEMLQSRGFQLHTSNPHHAILKSAGSQNPWTTLTPDGQEIPIELAISESHGGLHVHLRYETFVLFDTGDLETFGDELAASLVQHDTAV